MLSKAIRGVIFNESSYCPLEFVARNCAIISEDVGLISFRDQV